MTSRQIQSASHAVSAAKASSSTKSRTAASRPPSASVTTPGRATARERPSRRTATRGKSHDKEVMLGNGPLKCAYVCSSCVSGQWVCTDRQCPSTCAAWGNSHFVTFDGRSFDYRGSCEYILAQGTASETFKVIIQVRSRTSSVQPRKAPSSHQWRFSYILLDEYEQTFTNVKHASIDCFTIQSIQLTDIGFSFGIGCMRRPRFHCIHSSTPDLNTEVESGQGETDATTSTWAWSRSSTFWRIMMMLVMKMLLYCTLP